MAVDMVHCVEALKMLKTTVEMLSIPVNLITEVSIYSRQMWFSALSLAAYSLLCLCIDALPIHT